jgi:hypothetical protein
LDVQRFSPVISVAPGGMSITSDECRQLLSRYDEALTSRIGGHKSKNGVSLLELDRWRLTNLAKDLRERNPSYMTKTELEKLMDCKLYNPICELLRSDPEANSDRV